MIPVLKRLSIGKKLAVISITLTAVLVALSTYMLYELKDTMIEGRKLKLRGLVESALNVVNLYSKMEADGTLTPEEARRQAQNTLYGMNFDGKNYFFVVDTDGVLVAHPTRQESGRAHVRNPVTNAHLVCRLMTEKNNISKIT